MTMQAFMRACAGQYRRFRENPEAAGASALPGRAWILPDHAILSEPRDDGDSRYPYGSHGFNFWAHTSGYMSCNEGLFSVLPRAAEGMEPRVAFFAGFPGEDGWTRIPLLPVPVGSDEKPGEVLRYSVLTPASAWYFTETRGMCVAIRVFVSDDRTLCFSLLAECAEGRETPFYLASFFNPALGHFLFENGETRWFKESRRLENGIFQIRQNEDLSRTQSVSNYGILRRSVAVQGETVHIRTEETTSRYQFTGGARHSLHQAAALKNGTFGAPVHVTAFTEVAVAGDMLHFQGAPGGSVRLDWTLGTCTGDAGREALLRSGPSGAALDAALKVVEDSETQRHACMDLQVGRAMRPALRTGVFNAFFTHLKKQVEFCAGIKGYVQLSELSLIGIRDVFQAIEAQIFWQPDAGRAKMLEALNFIMPDGRCPRQYTLPSSGGHPPVMDLRPFIDQGVWVISTVVTYLKLTGDFAFLEASCGYHDIVDEQRREVRQSILKEDVLEHLIRIADYLVRHRDPVTGCVRALYGDWNDALDGLGVSSQPGRTYGSGVSVMASLQVYQNLMEMAELLGKLEGTRFRHLSEGYREQAEQLSRSLMQYALVQHPDGDMQILAGWGDERRYLVGGLDDPDHVRRYSLTSQAFWVLSGMLEKSPWMKPWILKALDTLDSAFGYKTYEPAFAPDTPGVGRIPKLPAGTAENGAAYIHATAFAIMALFRMGEAERAWEQLEKILPFTHRSVSCSPFVMPNSYCSHPELNIDGQSMADWQTGSSNVVMKLLLRQVFGVEPGYEGLTLSPAHVQAWETFTLRLPVRGCALTLIYRRSGVPGPRRYFVDGVLSAEGPALCLGWDKLASPARVIEIVEGQENGICSH